MRLSIVVPVLDEADRLEALLAELARDCPGVEVVVADGGSRDGSVEIAARAPGVGLVSCDRGRARQMNAGAALATGDDPPLPPRRHAPAVRSGRGRPARPRRPLGRLRPLRRPLRQTRGSVPADRPAHERPLAPDGHLHGRPGDLRPPRSVRAPGRLPRDRAHGGRRADAPAEAHRPLRSAEAPGHDLGPAMGAERRGADDRSHVDAALPLPLRGRAGPPAPLVLRSAGGRRVEREGRVSSGGASQRAGAPRATGAIGWSLPRGSPGARPAPRAGARRRAPRRASDWRRRRTSGPRSAER